MLVVKTSVATAGEKGLGLFSDEFLPKGTVWWRDDRKFNKVFTKAEIDALPNIAKAFLDTYASTNKDGDKYLCVDNARFQNHSDIPNTGPNSTGDWIVTRDVAAGEELTSDYRMFCETCRGWLDFENKEQIGE